MADEHAAPAGGMDADMEDVLNEPFREAVYVIPAKPVHQQSLRDGSRLIEAAVGSSGVAGALYFSPREPFSLRRDVVYGGLSSGGDQRAAEAFYPAENVDNPGGSRSEWHIGRPFVAEPIADVDHSGRRTRLPAGG